MVILDTLGKVKRHKKPGEDSYLVDYEVGSQLKTLADAVPGSTLLVVHHTRKAEAADFVDTVSGTQGIAGSVDFVLVLARKRHENNAILSVTGRDIIEAEYALHADDGVLWRLDGADLDDAQENVQQRRAEASMGDRQMDVYLVVAAAGGPVTAIDVASSVGRHGQRRPPGSTYDDCTPAGTSTRSAVVSSHFTPQRRGPKRSRRRPPSFSSFTSFTPSQSAQPTDTADNTAENRVNEVNELKEQQEVPVDRTAQYRLYQRKPSLLVSPVCATTSFRRRSPRRSPRSDHRRPFTSASRA